MLSAVNNILNSIFMDCEFDNPSIPTEQLYSSSILILGDLRVTVCFPISPLLLSKSLSSE